MTGAQHAQGSLQDRAVLQLAMRLELLQIEPVEQPHELLLRQPRDRSRQVRGPFEALLLQSLQPQAEPTPSQYRTLIWFLRLLVKQKGSG